MESEEYMKEKYKYFLHDIVEEYNLEKKVTSDGYVYIRILKSMYSLKQARLLAYNNLKTNLTPHGYEPIIVIIRM